MTDEPYSKIFAELSDEALLERYQSGMLTEQAAIAARDELSNRGLQTSSPATMEPNEEEDAAAEGDLVAVASNLSPVEASLLQGLLESEGIYAFVADANLMSVLPMWAHSLYGGARILVRNTRLADARRVLKAHADGDFALGPDDAGLEGFAKDTDSDANL